MEGSGYDLEGYVAIWRGLAAVWQSMVQYGGCGLEGHGSKWSCNTDGVWLRSRRVRGVATDFFLVTFVVVTARAATKHFPHFNAMLPCGPYSNKASFQTGSCCFGKRCVAEATDVLAEAGRGGCDLV